MAHTRSDKGLTELNGGRVSKDHAMIEALGALDETGAALGLAAALLTQDGLLEPAELIRRLQSELLDLGASLAGEHACFWPERLLELERQLAARAPLSRPAAFILQGQTPAGAALHLARTAARRAERRWVAAVAQPGPELAYLNRLSELLYIMALKAET